MDTVTTLERYAGYMANINTGGMLALSANPSDEDTECQDSVNAVNFKLVSLATGSSYTTGELNTAELLEKFQTMSFDFMDELDKCGGNEFNIVMDDFSNNWMVAVGGGLSLATQIGTGWANRDSSAWIAYDTMTRNRGTNDYSYKDLGEGIIMGLSQIIKFEGPALNIEVAPTNA